MEHQSLVSNLLVTLFIRASNPPTDQRTWIMSELSAKVLIVYVDEFVGESLTTLMEREGFKVLQASDGRTGLDMVQTELPELMLVDIKRGDLNGVNILREARHLNPNLFMIAITVHGDTQVATKAIDAGAHNSYLEKPLPIKEVNEAARQVFLNKKIESKIIK